MENVLVTDASQVWYEAVTQCFFSLSVSFGPLIMYSSFNNFKHNVHRSVCANGC